jgi:hypothetical protein
LIHPRRVLIGVFALLALTIAVFANAGRAEASTKCPNTFRVLHNDHVGKLSLSAGNYLITVTDQNELSCQRASDLFTKFLQDFDGKLPNGWKVKVKQSGFVKSPKKGFFVKRVSGAGNGGGGGGGRHPAKGEKICPGTFQVQHNDRIGNLHLRKGPYKITVIKKKRITCQKASNLFARFLKKPNGLPKGWKLKVQSATFLKKGKHYGFRVKQA